MGQGRKAKSGTAPGKRPLPPKPARAATEEPATPFGAIAEEAPPQWSPPKRERGEREQGPRTSPYERRNRGSANADDDAPKPHRKPARKRSTKACGQRRGASNGGGGR